MGMNISANFDDPPIRPRRMNAVRPTIRRIAKKCNPDYGVPSDAKRIATKGAVLSIIMYGLTVTPPHEDCEKLYEEMMCGMLDIPPGKERPEVVAAFLGYPTFKEQLAANMRRFKDKLKESPYPIIREAAQAAFEKRLPWARYAKEVLIHEEIEELRLLRKKHPAYLTDASHVHLLFHFMRPTFSYDDEAEECPLCHDGLDCGEHLLTECQDTGVCQLREGFEYHWGDPMTLLNEHNPFRCNWPEEEMMQLEYETTNEIEEARRVSVSRKIREEEAKFDQLVVEPCEDDRTRVYTDGACQNNQKVAGKAVVAGWGVFFDQDHPRNMGEPLAPIGPTNELSNNRGELTAPIRLLEEAPVTERFRIFTDSEYVLNGVTGKSKPKTNLDLWKRLKKLLRGRDVKWTKVKGHSNSRGNIGADALANFGMKFSVKVYPPKKANGDTWLAFTRTIKHMDQLRTASLFNFNI